jgi:hypothetical protein
VYQLLEARSVGYAIRFPRNEALERQIASLKPPEAEVPSSPIMRFHDFTYQAIGMWHSSVKTLDFYGTFVQSPYLLTKRAKRVYKGFIQSYVNVS